MRRSIAYFAALGAVLILAAGLFHFSAADDVTRSGSVGNTTELQKVVHGMSEAAALWDSYAQYLAPASGQSTVSGRTTSGGNVGVRYVWLTGFRRVWSSPVFQAADVFLSYLGRESAARSFVLRRSASGGVSCGKAASVSRPGDGYVFALRRIVI